MKTQGISLLMATGDAAMPTKGTKVSDSTFDSFMSRRGAGISVGSSEKEVISVNNKDFCAENSCRLDAKASGQMAKEPKMVSPKTDVEKMVEDVDVSEMTAQTMATLQKMYGLSEEELQDMLELLGMQIQDLLFQVQNEAIVPVNVNAIQEFILGVHGIDDAASFITNGMLSQELSQLTEELTAVLAEGFGVEPEEVADLQQKLMMGFAEQIQQAEGKATQEMSQDVETAGMEAGMEQMETFSLTVEAQQDGSADGDAASDFAKEKMFSSTDTLTQTTEVDRPAVSVFTENLTQALEQVSNAEELSANRTMVQIVEQVVRQVRIRVMPETTSMEMQLNPANLGRVHLTVATTGGIATATMVVENQMAKNALESQMITLKETFAEQGLKVEEVEVTVAEFGLKKENQQQQEEAGGRKQKRRFHTDNELIDKEDGVVDTNVTASERRDVNSMVDYTA